MRFNLHLAGMGLAVLLWILSGSGCASSPAAPAASGSPSSGLYVPQVPMTSYMQSQVGTSNELSPLAPAAARNVRKAGNQWTCEIDGQTMIFNPGSSRWEPQQ